MSSSFRVKANANVGSTMHFEMDVLIKSFPSGWASIFHCGTSDSIRSPGIWIHPNSKQGFHVKWSDNSDWNRGPDTGAITTNTWYHLALDVTSSRMVVKVDGVVKYDAVKSSHVARDNLVCYLGDPWYPAANVLVKNLHYGPTKVGSAHSVNEEMMDSNTAAGSVDEMDPEYDDYDVMGYDSLAEEGASDESVVPAGGWSIVVHYDDLVMVLGVLLVVLCALNLGVMLCQRGKAKRMYSPVKFAAESDTEMEIGA